MDFETYQRIAHTTAQYPRLRHEDKSQLYEWIYPALGLGAESGELLNKLKKIIRDDTVPDKNILIGELGDILWYVSELCNLFDISLNTVAEQNIAKLAKRARENKIRGSGDNR